MKTQRLVSASQVPVWCLRDPEEAALQPPCAPRGAGRMQPLPRAKGIHGVAHPPPRFHNGTLLDRRKHRYRTHLELHGLHPDQAGTYHCKAWNDAGAVRSGTAQLTVLGERPQQPYPQP